MMAPLTWIVQLFFAPHDRVPDASGHFGRRRGRRRRTFDAHRVGFFLNYLKKQKKLSKFEPYGAHGAPPATDVADDADQAKKKNKNKKKQKKANATKRRDARKKRQERKKKNERNDGAATVALPGGARTPRPPTNSHTPPN